MKYRSTRDASQQVTFCEAVAKALAPDGGLFYPEEFPQLNPDGEDFASISAEILTAYSDESFRESFHRICAENYKDFPIPVVKTKAGNFMELFHGPSGAFKDVALTMLPKIAALCGQQDTVYVTATSGDTGKAALEAFKNLPGTRILVFYPEQGVAPLQKLQMQTQSGDNVCVVAIEGNFDDAQRAAKEILSSGDKGISSCNSINIARLLAQVPYYFHAVREMEKAPISFIVPSGNFGDILAGYYAKRMGAPIDRLVVATNSNTVLKDFFRTGIYDRRRDLVKTSSPSMDILVSSNLERLLCHLYGTEKTTEWMRRLEKDGFYEVPMAPLRDFSAYSATEEDVQRAIRTVYEEAGYIMDPHTACGWVAWDEMGRPENAVILSTASPSKFPETIVEAITGKEAGPKEALDILSTYGELHPALQNLYDQSLRFSRCIPREDAVKAFYEFREGKSCE